MNKKWINSALNCQAYSSFKGVSSDQKIVTAKYICAYAGMWHKQPQLNIMTGPCLTIRVLAKNMC